MDQRKPVQFNSDHLEFYKQVYPQQRESKVKLIPLDEISADWFFCMDCCGWYYKKQWAELNILGFETINTVKTFKLDSSYCDGLINYTSPEKLYWPKVFKDNVALIFDRSMILKYQNIDHIITVLSNAAENYRASVVAVQIGIHTTDGPRLIDRFTDLVRLQLLNYVITYFTYDTKSLQIRFKRKISV